MKKIIIATMFLLIVLTGCKMRSYKEITYNEYVEKIENEENFILFIGSETCSHCNDYKSKVEKIVKDYQIMIYYIDINKFTDEQLNKFKTQINFSGTPTTVFIENGKEKTDSKGNVTPYRINGNVDYNKLIKKFQKAGYIKE